MLAAELQAKRLGLLRDLVPKAAKVAVLLNPNYGPSGNILEEIQQAASGTGQPTRFVQGHEPSCNRAAFTALAEQHCDALFIANDPFFVGLRDLIVALSAAMQSQPSITSANMSPPAG